MAGPSSEEERAAIMSAAVRIIAAQGLSATMETVSKEAGVSCGLLFTHFETKADLFNALHVELMLEMTSASMADLSPEGDLRDQILHMWSRWLRWATSCPEKRCTMQRLREAKEITQESRKITHEAHLRFRDVIERSRERGSIRSLASEDIYALLTGVSEATTDFISTDPANAEKYALAGFESMWRLLS